MDIAALSMVMSQSRVQESAGIAVIKMEIDTGKETATQMTEMMSNVAIAIIGTIDILVFTVSVVQIFTYYNYEWIFNYSSYGVYLKYKNICNNYNPTWFEIILLCYNIYYRGRCSHGI